MLPARIHIDGRAGSVDLIAPLVARGVPAVEQHLPFGDLSWLGFGPDGVVSVGVEFKTLGDLLSCMMNDRFAAHQLPGLQDCFQVAYLLVEGVFKPGEEGELLQLRGRDWREPSWSRRRLMFLDLDHWLASMEHQGGVILHKTGTRAETLAWIHSRWSWWQKEWSRHKSITRAHHTSRPKPDGGRLGFVKPDRPSRLESMYAQVFGWELAKKVKTKFPTLQRAMDASDADWNSIEGVGPTMLKRWRGL